MTLSLFPSQDSVRQSFGSPLPQPSSKSGPTPYAARSELYGAWSVVEDAKDKAKKFSNEAQAEFDKASAKAKPKPGTIELYSGQYYAACVVGGLMACVRFACDFYLFSYFIARESRAYFYTLLTFYNRASPTRPSRPWTSSSAAGRSTPSCTRATSRRGG